MHRRTDPSQPSPPLSRLMGSIFGARTESPVPHTPHTRRLPADDVPDLLQPAVQSGSPMGTIDAQIGRLLESLPRHHEGAQGLARQLALLPDTQRQLAALRAEADGLQPALIALDRVYGELAAAITCDNASELEQQESEHRQARLSHYEQLQSAMDAQYADTVRDAAQSRAANAQRLFQRDLDSYRQGQAVRPRPRTPVSTPVAAIVLPPSSQRDMDDFFSDVSATDEPRSERPQHSLQEDDTPSVAILEDEDFE
ncbi:hypothetical protein LPJ54_002174 [Coemansia sp. RSA 1824]|nr:hypothetical protein LPJ54_002174 [Coemansia sp. RSA 1824]